MTLPRSSPACSARSPPTTSSPMQRDSLSRKYLTRTVVLLREAIDSGPELAEQVKADIDIKALESRPQFQTLMSGLVDVVGK